MNLSDLIKLNNTPKAYGETMGFGEADAEEIPSGEMTEEGPAEEPADAAGDEGYVEESYGDESYGDEESEKQKVKVNYKRFISAITHFLQTEGSERPKRVNIFTTNYDLMFEWTLDKYIQDNSLIYFNDGARGVFCRYIDSKNYNLNVSHSGYYDRYIREIPTINLFKMHGSVSWLSLIHI